MWAKLININEKTLNSHLTYNIFVSGVIMYKSIMVGNHERTKEVIHSAMLKHGLGGAPENYTLSQLLPDKGKPEIE